MRNFRITSFNRRFV